MVALSDAFGSGGRVAVDAEIADEIVLVEPKPVMPRAAEDHWLYLEGALGRPMRPASRHARPPLLLLGAYQQIGAPPA